MKSQTDVELEFIQKNIEKQIGAGRNYSDDTPSPYYHDIAARYNQGKPKYSLLPLDYLEPGVRALEYGAEKYSRGGHRKGFPETEIVDSLMRHLSALLAGNINDNESKLSHIAHIQANAMFLGNPNNIKDLTGERVDDNSV